MATTADSIERTTGDDDGGSVSDTTSVNATYHSTGEVTGTPGFDVKCIFVTQSASDKAVVFDGKYVGSPSHNVFAYVYDHIGDDWERITAAAQDLPSSGSDAHHAWAFLDQAKYISTGTADAGELWIRFAQPDQSGNPNHVLDIDRLEVIDINTHTWVAAGAGTWGTDADWSPAQTPHEHDAVIFDNTSDESCTLDEDTEMLTSFDMQSTYDGDFNCATYDLDICGPFTLDGSGEFDLGTGTHTFTDCVYDNVDQGTVTRDSSTCVFVGTCSIVSSQSHDLTDVTISLGTTTLVNSLDVQGDLTVDGTLSISNTRSMRNFGATTVSTTGSITGAGRFDLTTPNVDQSITLVGSATIDVATLACTNPLTESLTPFAAGTYDSARVLISATAAGRVFHFGAGSYTFTGATGLDIETTGSGVMTIDMATNDPTIVVQGPLAVTETAGTLTITCGDVPIECQDNVDYSDGGNLTHNANPSSAADFLLTGTAGQVFNTDSVTIGDVDINKPVSGNVEFATAVYGLGLVDMAGNFDHTSGTLSANADAKNIDGDVTFAGGTVNMGSATWTIEGDFDYESVGTLNDDTSTVVMTGSSANLTIKNTVPLYNLTIASGAVVQQTGETWLYTNNLANVIGTYTVTATKNLRINSSELQVSGTLDGAGGLHILDPSAGEGLTSYTGSIEIATIVYRANSATAQLAAGDFSSSAVSILVTSTAGTWTPDSGSYTFGSLTIASSATDVLTITNSNNPSFAIAGNFTVTDDGAGLTYTKGTGTITFNGTNHTYADADGVAPALEAIVVGCSGTFTQAAALTCDGFTIQSGTLAGAFDITTANGGDFLISVGAAVTPADLDDITWTIAGDCTLRGSSAGSLLDLQVPDAGSAGGLAIDCVGTLTAFYANLTNCDASPWIDDLISQRLFAGVLTDSVGSTDAALSRASASHLTNAAQTADVLYANNAPRYATKLLPSVSDGAVITDDVLAEGGTADLAVQCQDGTYVYAKALGAGDKKLYKSATGNAPWTLTSSQTDLSEVWCLANGTLIAADGLAPATMIYSLDQGATWANCTANDANITLAQSHHMCLWQAPNGTVIFAEYGDGASHSVWRSINSGITWTEVFTDTDIRHFHTPGYHAATGIWVLSAGDLNTISRLFYSTNDGVTWQVVPGYDENQLFQPVKWLDTGNSTRLMFGGDTVWQIGWLNMVTWVVEPTLTDIRGEAARNFVFELIQGSDGLIYASNNDNSGSDEASGIWVSADGNSWVRWFQAGEYTGIRIRCEHNERLHGEVFNSVGRFVSSLATLSEAGSVAVDPATTNLFSDSDESSIESSVGSWVGGGGDAFARDTDEAFHGSASVLTSDPATSTARVVSGGLAVSEGDVLYGRMRILRDTQQGSVIAYWQYYDGSWNFLSPSNARYFVMPSDFWNDVALPSIIVQAGWTQLRMYVETNSIPDSGSLRMDAAQISTSPGRWQLGGSASVDDELSYTQTMPAAWTHRFVIWTDRASNDYDVAYGSASGTADIGYQGYIASWVIDASNYAHLYFDADSSAFVFQRVVAGAPQSEVASPTVFFHRNSPIRFSLRADGSNLQLSFSNGAGTVNLAQDGTIAGIVSGDVDVKFGDSSGTNILPMQIGQDELFNVSLDDEPLWRWGESSGIAWDSTNGGGNRGWTFLESGKGGLGLGLSLSGAFPGRV